MRELDVRMAAFNNSCKTNNDVNYSDEEDADK